MQKFRILFFQTLLIILAVAFTFTVRFAASRRAVSAGSFGDSEMNTGITVAEVFGKMAGERVER